MLRFLSASASLLAIGLGLAVAWPAAADPNLEYPILLAIKEHYVGRLQANGCTSFFRYYSTAIDNWRWTPDEVKAEVVFTVQYIGPPVTTGNVERARNCLALNISGVFKPDEMYQTAPLVYTLSRWTQGWHVDKLEYQP